MSTKSIAPLFAALLVLSGCATTPSKSPAANNGQETAAAWPFPDSMDALSAAPKNHKLLYEDAKVRILDVTVQPGEKENMHSHRWPSTLIVDSPARKKEYTSDGQVILTERPPAATPLPLIVTRPPEKPHAIENLDTKVLHLYRIEFKN